MSAVPNYQQFMEPCLKVLSGGRLIQKKELIDLVSDEVGLSGEDRQAVSDSGRNVVRIRITWSLAYLKQARAIDNPERGKYMIMERGETLLSSSDRPINTKALRQFEEFRDFQRRSRTRETSPGEENGGNETELTPDEQLSAAARAIRAEVQTQLLKQLLGVDPTWFEHVVVDVLKGMGYGVEKAGAARVVGRSGDEGIDGVIDIDILGLDSIYVQAKRWRAQVGRPEVQAFAGALQGQNATKGVMITTSTFSAPAIEYAQAISNSRIILIDGEMLAGLMYDHGVGVSDATVVRTRKVDTDYFATDD